MVEQMDIERELRTAKAKLQAFEDAITPDQYLARLRRESVAHPLLLSYQFLLGLMAVGIFLALAVLGLPLYGNDLLVRSVAAFEVGIGLPLPLVLTTLAFSFGGLGAGARHLAVQRGTASPMLPAERIEHQRLASEVARLTSKKNVGERVLNY